MPIHDVSYRSWDGKRTSEYSRWTIISQSGIKSALKVRWLRRILFVAWLPVMYWGIGFFFIEQAIDTDNSTLASSAQAEIARSAIGRQLSTRFAMFPHAQQLADSFSSDDTAQIRNDVWRWLLMIFFRYPQSILLLFLVGSVAPSLIALDIRSRAFLLYFSRPIGKLEYMFGKLTIPGSFIIAITTLPALGLYVFAIMMSPSFNSLLNTWDIPFRICLATLVLVIPTTSIALMLSSLTNESRYANFSWFAVWALGHGAWLTVLVSTAISLDTQPRDVLQSPTVENWSVLSLYNCLGDAQALVFGFESFNNVWRSLLALVIVTLFSLVVLYRRVSAPTRI